MSYSTESYAGFCIEWMDWWPDKPRIGPQPPESILAEMVIDQLVLVMAKVTIHHEPLWAAEHWSRSYELR